MRTDFHPSRAHLRPIHFESAGSPPIHETSTGSAPVKIILRVTPDCSQRGSSEAAPKVMNSRWFGSQWQQSLPESGSGGHSPVDILPVPSHVRTDPTPDNPTSVVEKRVSRPDQTAPWRLRPVNGAECQVSGGGCLQRTEQTACPVRSISFLRNPSTCLSAP